MSRILSTGGVPGPRGVSAPREVPGPGGACSRGEVSGPGGCLVPGGCVPGTATAAGGTHPTGMHCYS